MKYQEEESENVKSQIIHFFQAEELHWNIILGKKISINVQGWNRNSHRIVGLTANSLKRMIIEWREKISQI